VIQQEAQSATPLLNRDDDFIQRVLRDMYGADVNRMWLIPTPAEARKAVLGELEWRSSTAGLLIDHHHDRISIMEYFRINAAIRSPKTAS